MTSRNETTPCQWRWDRFDVKHVTSLAWASRNCVGMDSDMESTHQAMHRRVIQDEKEATGIIAAELHQFVHDAATIAGMTYRCKQTNLILPCINIKDVRLAWLQDGGKANLVRLAWIFYYYGTELHRMGRSGLTHGEWVEKKVMTSMNVSYVHLADLPIGKRTCLQQLYSKKFNALRTNTMRQSEAVQHTSMVNKEQPRVEGMFKKNFKRKKTLFFVTMNHRNKSAWHKVKSDIRQTCKYKKALCSQHANNACNRLIMKRTLDGCHGVKRHFEGY